MEDNTRRDVSFSPRLRRRKIGMSPTRTRNVGFFDKIRDKLPIPNKKQPPSGSGGGGRRTPGPPKNKWLQLFSLKWFLLVITTAVLLMGGFATALMLSAEFLPLEQMDKKYTPAIIYDKDGKEYARLNKELVEPLTLEQMRKHNELLVETVKKVEDARFDDHGGVDFQALARAFVKNIFMGKREGGGTITMQVARNVVLDDIEQTITRKLKEIAVAWNLERQYGKDRILEAYLNNIPMGNGLRGVQAGAKAYFNKDLTKDKLTPGEVAILAGLPKAPEGYNPYRGEEHKERLKKRQRTVLMIMAREDDMDPLITEAEEAEWSEKKLPLQPKANVEKYTQKTRATPFDGLIAEEIKEKFPEFQFKQLSSSGLKIYTNIDPKVQKALTDALQNNDLFREWGTNKKMPRSEVEAGAVVINPKDGTIVAIGGGRYYQPKVTRNRAFDQHQPGSTIKPLTVYAPAVELNQGFNEYTMLKDEKIEVRGKVINNFDLKYYGDITMGEALKKSLNASTIWLLENYVTDKKAFEFGKKLGLPLQPEDENPSPLGLGGLTKGVSTLDMAQAYSVFLNEGKYFPVHLVTAVEGRVTGEDEDRKIEAKYEPVQVFSKQTAWYMTRMLRNNIMDRNGTASARLSGDREVAGKSGTTQGKDKGWFVGFTPDLLTAVNVYNEPNLNGDKKDRHYDITGAGAPANVFRTVMNKAHEGKPKKKFVKPEGVSDPTAPLKELRVKASYKNGEVKLNWNEAGKNVVYKVARSEDGNNYQEIATDLKDTSFVDKVEVGFLDQALSIFGKEKVIYYQVTATDPENPNNHKTGTVKVSLTDDKKQEEESPPANGDGNNPHGENENNNPNNGDGNGGGGHDRERPGRGGWFDQFFNPR